MGISEAAPRTFHPLTPQGARHTARSCSSNPLTLIACSPDRPATTAFLDVDLSADPQQAQDRPGSQVSDLNAAAPKTRTGSSAWLEPSPASFSFTADDSAWKTFTVRTSSDLDSVLVVVNPTGKDRALGMAGGSTPPSRN